MLGQDDMVQSRRPALALLSLRSFWKMGRIDVFWSSALSEALRVLLAMRAAATVLVVALGRVTDEDLPRSDEVNPTTPKFSMPRPLPPTRESFPPVWGG